MEKSFFKDVIVRKAEREDFTEILELKKELAAHQNMIGLPMLTVEELQRDAFDVSPPCFHCIVAVIPQSNGKNNCTRGKVVGYALYFYAYAAFEGKALHLEDLCVSSVARGTGCGLKLMKELAKIALEEDCVRLQLEVLDWNPSKKFYDNLGGKNFTIEEGWHNFRLANDAIQLNLLNKQ